MERTEVQWQEECHPLHNKILIGCEECLGPDKDECDIQGNLAFMVDSSTPMGVPQRALLTLPHGLGVGRSSISGAGLGVLNQGPTLPPGLHFGPFEGEESTRDRAIRSDYSWEVLNCKGESEYIDASRDSHSNWMRYVNCARNKTEGNLIALQHRGVIFFHCCRSILPGDELLFWPGGRFMDRFKDPSDQIWLRKRTFSELSTDLSYPAFFCHQCQLSFTTESYLERHTNRSHLLDLTLTEPRSPFSNDVTEPEPEAALADGLAYRCCQCPKSYKLKAHLQRHMQTVHFKVKPYCCIHCKRCFAQLSCLARHLNRVHRKKLRPADAISQPSSDHTQNLTLASDAPDIMTPVLFLCPHCPFSTSVERDLSLHIRRHGQKARIKKERNHNPESSCAPLETGETPDPLLEALPPNTLMDDAPESQPEATTIQLQMDEATEKDNSCSQCGKTFKQKGHVLRHIRGVHSNVRPYSCPQCNKCFAQGYDLARHQTQVHGKQKKRIRAAAEVRRESSPRLPSSNSLPLGNPTGRPPSERLRNRRLKSSSNAKANTVQQRPSKTTKSANSDSTLDALDVGETDVVGGEDQYTCTECQRTYSNPESLEVHHCIPSGVTPPYSCSICRVTFKRYTTLKKHKLNKHPKQRLSFCCTYCGRLFSRAAGLQRHLKTEVCKDIQLSSETFNCSNCQYSFTEERYLQKHVKRHHPNEYVAVMCADLIPQQPNGERKSCHCFQCGKSYKYVQSFKSHRCFRSAAAKLHLCDRCGKGFSCLYSLKQHQRVHTGEKPFRCPHCEKAFSHSGQLNVHVRVHTGERPYLCTECGECFRQSGDLKRHERKHSGVKPCTCPECGRSFSRPQSLKAHVLLHNGVRQFRCEQCGKSFSRNYHLTRHYEKMHS